MLRRLPILCLVFLLHLCVAHLTASFILDYTVTNVTRDAVGEGHSWSTYRDGVCDRGHIVSRAELQRRTKFTPIHARTPFFVQQVNWYVSRYGFLSPSPVPMCPFFCRDTARNTLYGFYSFNHGDTPVYGGGGDWPMVGLYVAEFAPTLGDGRPSRVCYETHPSPSPTASPAVTCTTMEVANATLSEDYNSSGRLNAQATVCDNGTVVMRYRSVPLLPGQHPKQHQQPLQYEVQFEQQQQQQPQQPPQQQHTQQQEDTQDQQQNQQQEQLLQQHQRKQPRAKSSAVPFSPSTGVILSRRLRRVLTTPTVENDIVAYRLEPIWDNCSTNTTSEAACARRRWCVWCRATRVCAAESIVAEVCPSGAFDRAHGAAGLAGMRTARTDGDRTIHEEDGRKQTYRVEPIHLDKDRARGAQMTSDTGDGTSRSAKGDSAAAAAAAQSFYRVTMHDNASLDTPPISAVTWYPGRTGTSRITLPVPFRFPYFTNTSIPFSSSYTSHLYLTSPSMTFFDESSSVACNPLWQTCPNGNVSYAILPFQIAAVWTRDTHVIQWNGTCDSAHERNGTAPRHELPGATCQSVTVQVHAILPYAFALSSDVRSGYVGGLHYAYQLYVDSRGEVKMAVTREEELRWPPFDGFGVPTRHRRTAADAAPDGLYTYPPALVGMFRQGIADHPATVAIPPALLYSGTSIHFVPDGACADCGRHGSCAASLGGVCVCAAGFAGPRCEGCAAGHYGPACLPCRVCQHGGRCRAGRDGSGGCACVAPYSGIDCGVRCEAPNGHSAWAPAPDEQEPRGNTSRRQADKQQQQQQKQTRAAAEECTLPLTAFARAGRDWWRGSYMECADCSIAGGYCECGKCRCLPGWTGNTCSVVEADGCRIFSMEGCPVCTGASGCSFCFDNVCFDPNMSGTPGGYSCSYAVHSTADALCTYAERVTGSDAWTFVTTSFLMVVVFLVLMPYMCIMCVRYAQHPIIDEHLTYAEGGIANYTQPRQTREVLQLRRVPHSEVPAGQYVMAIPLKQISLKRLYARQQASKKNHTC